MSPSRIRAAALAAGLLLAAAAAEAQEKKVTLVFTSELVSQVATDNQGEQTAEIVNRLLGLSPSVAGVRLTRSGGKVIFDVAVRLEEDARVEFRFALDRMVYYRMSTARTDVAGMTAALQEARASEPLLLAAAYRHDDRYAMLDLTVDLRPALATRRAEQERTAAAAREAEAKAAAERAAAQARAVASAGAVVWGGEGAAPPPGQAVRYLSGKRLGREAAPVVDGLLADAAWLGAQQFSFEVQGASGKILVASWALWSPERIWILLRWPDREKNDVHRPWVWSKPERAYVAGREVEDAVSLAFAREGRIGDCMLAGGEAVADLWFWRAGRTDPSGFAEDGSLSLSRQSAPRANSYPTRAGGAIFIVETPDAGDPPYQSQALAAYAGDRIPRYIARTPSGSIADVAAKGFWRDGYWNVEFSRALTTGDPADVAFFPGRDLRLSVAVFDHREGADHSTSKEILLRLDEGAP